MSPRGRHRSGHGDPLNGNAITDCVAVAESFAVSRLLVLCPAIPERDVFSRKSRLTAWRGHGVVDLSSYGRWSALMGYAEVRNAMLHGLGRRVPSTSITVGPLRWTPAALIWTKTYCLRFPSC